MKKQVMLNESKLKAIVAEVLKGILNEGYGREFEKNYPTDAIFEYMDDIDEVYGKDDDWYEQVMPQLKEEYAVVWNSEESENERGKFHDNTDFRMCQEFYDDIDKLQLEGWGDIKEDLKACGDVFVERNIDRLKEDADEVVDDYFAWDSFEDKEEW